MNAGVLVSIPMKKFNKATGKSGYLGMHEQFEYHKDAAVRGVSLCEESNLPYKISSLNMELYDTNFSILKSIVKAIIFCGKLNVPVRGHRDDSTSTTVNKGNFLALLHLVAEIDMKKEN